MAWGTGPTWLVAIGFVYGLAIGSFLNVVIHRLPGGESIVLPPSHCPKCDNLIKPLDNIPVVSYLLLRGRCRDCGAAISPRYPAIELLTGLVFAGITSCYGGSWLTPLLMVFAAALLAAAAIDFDHGIIPDEISLYGIALGLFAVPVAQMSVGASWLEAFQASLLGGAIGAGALWLVAFLHARISVALGRTFEHWPGEGEELPRPLSADYWLWFPGMGLGDIKLLGMIGVFLGPWGVLETIIAASVLGLVFGVGHALYTKSFASPFGFAPAIAGGALVSMLVPLAHWMI